MLHRFFVAVRQLNDRQWPFLIWLHWHELFCASEMKRHVLTEGKKMQSVIKKLRAKTHWRQKSLSHVNSGQHQKNQMGLISSVSSFTHVAIIRNGPRAPCAHVENLGELRWAKAVSLYGVGQLDRYQLFSTFYIDKLLICISKKISSVITSINHPSIFKEY